MPLSYKQGLDIHRCRALSAVGTGSVEAAELLLVLVKFKRQAIDAVAHPCFIPRTIIKHMACSKEEKR